MNHRYVLIGLVLFVCAILLSFLFFLRSPHPTDANVCEALTEDEVVNRVRFIPAFFGPSDKAACLCLGDMNACNRVCSLFSETPHTPKDIRTITASLQWVNSKMDTILLDPFREAVNTHTCTFDPSAESTPMSLYRLGGILQFMRSDDAIPLKYVTKNRSLKSKEELLAMFKDALAATNFRKLCSSSFSHFKPLERLSDLLVSACHVGFVSEKEMLDRVKSMEKPIVKYFADYRGVRNHVTIDMIKSVLNWPNFHPASDYSGEMLRKMSAALAVVKRSLSQAEIVSVMPAEFYTDERETCLSTKDEESCRQLVDKFRLYLRDEHSTRPAADFIESALYVARNSPIDPSEKIMMLLTSPSFKEIIGEDKSVDLMKEAKEPIDGLHNLLRNLKYPRALTVAARFMESKTEDKIRDFWYEHYNAISWKNFYPDVFLFASVAPKTNDGDLFVSIGKKLCNMYPSMIQRYRDFCTGNEKSYKDLMRYPVSLSEQTLSNIITSQKFSIKDAIRQIALQVYGQRLDDVIAQSDVKQYKYVLPAGLEADDEDGGTFDLDSILFGDSAIPKLQPEHNPYHNDDCSICWMRFQDGKIVSRTSCGHLFHKRCLDNWVKIRKTCPTCNI